MQKVSQKSSFDGKCVAKNLILFVLFDFVFVVCCCFIHYVTYNWRYSTVTVGDIFSIEFIVAYNNWLY